MAADEQKSPVTVDIGASAKLEVKTEIPTESSGRLLDALTDIIRPFSEKRGLKADQIRLQREDVLIKIADKARKRLELENLKPNSVPNKFMVPFLEKASCEEPDSELIDTWANLLCNEAVSQNPMHLIFVDILSKLGSEEVRLLNDIYLSYLSLAEADVGLPSLSGITTVAFSGAPSSLEDLSSAHWQIEKYSERWLEKEFAHQKSPLELNRELYAEMLKSIAEACWASSTPWIIQELSLELPPASPVIRNPNFANAFSSLELLKHMNLIKQQGFMHRRTSSSSEIAGHHYILPYRAILLIPTELGLQLSYSCSGSSDGITKK